MYLKRRMSQERAWSFLANCLSTQSRIVKYRCCVYVPLSGELHTQCSALSKLLLPSMFLSSKDSFVTNYNFDLWSMVSMQFFFSFFKLLNVKLRAYNFLFSYFPFIKYLRYSHSNYGSFLYNRHIRFQKYCYSVSDNSNYIYMHKFNLSLETCWKTKDGPFISLI